MNYLLTNNNKQSIFDLINDLNFTLPHLHSAERTGDTIRFNSTSQGHTVEVDLPGVKKEDCVVEMLQAGSGVRVYVKANRKIVHKGGQKEETFTREFTLNEARQENVSASLENGVLTVTAPIETNRINRKVLQLK